MLDDALDDASWRVQCFRPDFNLSLVDSRDLQDGVDALHDQVMDHSVRHGLGEFRLLRVVDAATVHVHCQPGHLELLVARSIDLSKLRDRRYLAQKPQRIERR